MLDFNPNIQFDRPTGGENKENLSKKRNLNFQTVGEIILGSNYRFRSIDLPTNFSHFLRKRHETVGWQVTAGIIQEEAVIRSDLSGPHCLTEYFGGSLSPTDSFFTDARRQGNEMALTRPLNPMTAKPGHVQATTGQSATALPGQAASHGNPHSVLTGTESSDPATVVGADTSPAMDTDTMAA